MENTLKQRIVGALVLVILAIIFLPHLFDGEQKLKVMRSQIPEPPKFAENKQHPYKIERQALNETEDSSKAKQILAEKDQAESESLDKNVSDQSNKNSLLEQNDQQIEEAQSTTKQEHVKQKVQNKKTVDSEKSNSHKNALNKNAWVIQLGSFADKKNAEQLVTKLRDKGYKAYVLIALTEPNTKTHRVFVGPELKKDSLTQQLVKLEQLTKLKGLVVAYDPLEH